MEEQTAYHNKLELTIWMICDGTAFNQFPCKEN